MIEIKTNTKKFFSFLFGAEGEMVNRNQKVKQTTRGEVYWRPPMRVKVKKILKNSLFLLFGLGFSGVMHGPSPAYKKEGQRL
jgi:hypothetical protein